MLDVVVPRQVSAGEESKRTIPAKHDARDSTPLATWVRAAVADRNLRMRWQRELGSAEALADFGLRVAASAYEAHNTDALRDLHATLFTLYELHVAAPESGQACNQFDPALIALRNRLERSWLGAEFVQYRTTAHRERVATVDEAVRAMWSASEAGTHKLFDFLETDATQGQMLAFFQSDASLNTRFFDLIAFALIGSTGFARKELVQNMWDEAGRGNPDKSHVFLFENLLKAVGVNQRPAERYLDLGLQGLIGHNLFMATSTNREHYFKSLGVMAITELMDPHHYEKLVRGCRRLGLGSEGELEYYEEHVTIDVIHGDGWLKNVIAPAAANNPDAADDILFGAHLRLKTCAAYYDELQARLLLAR